MRPVESLGSAEARGIRAIFTDIDGTLTDEAGRVPSVVFGAMERVRRAGLAVVPVTGRPAGWCDLIARTWPVDGVIGENGGLCFRRGAGATLGPASAMIREYVQAAEVRAENRVRLDRAAKQILARFPGSALAADQPYRELDVAIDFREDVPPLEARTVDAIATAARDLGATVRISDIHVNFWFGSFDKGGAVDRFAEAVLEMPPETRRTGVVFVGDSPNDEPLFERFPLAIGVANVLDHRARLRNLPAFLCRGRGSAGFVEAIDHLLDVRPG
jgi:HAD superfamily hydrolase (TIGR01484 family)